MIFGGSAGIGRAAARVLAADGARVAIVGRRRDRAEASAAELAEATGATVVALADDVIAFLLSDRAAYLTGATINVDGGTDF